MMVKAGALYFSIVVALVIAVLTSSLLLLAVHYRNSYLRELRFARLLRNMDVAIAYALADKMPANSVKKIDLYQDGQDSVTVVNRSWGLYQLAILEAFIKQDTLKRGMLIGTETDSLALYLSDEDRPLSLSGFTKVMGNVSLPKSGIKKAYVDGRSFAFNKLVENGTVSSSDRQIPKLDSLLVEMIKQGFIVSKDAGPLPKGSAKHTFLKGTLYFDITKRSNLSGLSISGNIILQSGSAVVISASSELDGVQIYAPSILVEEGFKGACQLFATDSIIVEDNVQFYYPSVVAVLGYSVTDRPAKISFGKNGLFEGIMLIHQQKWKSMEAIMSLDSNMVVKGELYCGGILEFSQGVKVVGKSSCSRFLMNYKQNIYENLLIDVTLSREARSNYYLSSRIFANGFSNKVLQWLK